MTRRLMMVAVLGLAGAIGAGAQGEGHATTAAQVEPAKAFDAALSSVEKEFMSAANAMPAEKYSFTPASLSITGAKYDGVKTFAQEVTHVTQANYYFFSAASGLKPEIDVKAIGALKTKAEIVAAAAASFAFGHKAMATLTKQNAFEVVKGDEVQTRATLAGESVAHAFDHYGQMVEYLRMNGIVPPASVK